MDADLPLDLDAGSLSLETELFDGEEQTTAPATVAFRFIVDGEAIAFVEAADGEAVSAPESPAAPEGMAFAGWFDADGNRRFVDGAEVARASDGGTVEVFARFEQITPEDTPETTDAQSPEGEDSGEPTDTQTEPSPSIGDCKSQSGTAR